MASQVSGPRTSGESIESSMRPLTPRVRRYVAEEAQAAGITPAEVLSRDRRRPCAYARRRVAVRLSNDGFNNGQIGRWLNLDVSTVHYYMQGKMRPAARGGR
jgi:DNA-binding NarL/FixJ family response regulator